MTPTTEQTEAAAQAAGVWEVYHSFTKETLGAEIEYWKARAKMERERCAQVAEWWDGGCAIGFEIAKAIRALKDKP